MNPSDFYLALIFGVLLSMLMEELLGVSTGGMIVPGVLALHVQNIDIMIYIFLISFITYLVVEKLLAKHMILYGKRKFAFMVLVALLIKVGGDQLYPLLPFAAVAFRGIGAIVPALMANTYTRQGIKFTIPKIIVSTAVVYGLLQVVHYF